MTNNLEEKASEEMDDKQFLGYCIGHSQTPRALFHIDHINRLYRMAGMPVYVKMNGGTYGTYYENKEGDRIGSFAPIHETEMNEIIEIIKKKQQKN